MYKSLEMGEGLVAEGKRERGDRSMFVDIEIQVSEFGN